MFLASIVLSALVLIGLGVQVFQSFDLQKRFRNYVPVVHADDQLPSCAVVLSLRGCDPGLAQSLQRLLTQEYPDYHLFVLLDHESDPAKALVEEVANRLRPSNLTIRVIDEHLPTCVLIANNLASVLPELADRFELIAWVDADAAIWPDWLRTLVSPLVSTDLSVIYGNRWYMPQKRTFASLARFVWNYGSVQQMVYFKYPWAGSLAMKSSFIRNTDYVEALKKSLVNDTLIAPVAQKAGLKVDFHPGVMVVNQEDIRLKDFFYWMSRQLVFGRLYHPTWPIVLGTGAMTGLVIGASMTVNLLNVFLGEWLAFTVLSSSLFLFWCVWVSLVFQLDNVVGREVAKRNEPRRWWDLSTAVKIFLVAPFVQFIFLGGLFKATLMRQVRWRGIDYQIKGPDKIRMLAYQPYSKVLAQLSAQSAVDENESIL